ncbi:MAG TPA: cysteine desulfurase [Candidatus Nanoarchaeia archaeon]|nr:cysteine desulfurase [Candidatus Nanoarchaeia archaeon]
MKLNNQIVKELKKDFPIFDNYKNLVYLDNGATTQKPRQVIEKIKEFYESFNANIHRGLYELSERATEEYKRAREIVAKFINAKTDEIIFTKSTTDSINSLAYCIVSIIPKEKNEIVLTEMEHHSNLIPWQEFAKRLGFKLRFIRVKDDFTLDLEDARTLISEKTAIISLTHISNSLGIINPIKEISRIAKEKNALVVVDAAQSTGHMKVDVKDLGCDFLAFSGHKMLAPFGIGVLYGKRELLEKMNPFNFGGGMINSVSFEDASWAEIPEKFEAGTQNIAGAIALAEAIKYLEKIGMENIELWERELVNYLYEKIKNLDFIEIYNKNPKTGILSINVKGIHPHDVSSLLDDYDIAVRAGHHCNMPLMKRLRLHGTIRISLYFYNTFEDIDKLVEGIKKVEEKFGR